MFFGRGGDASSRRVLATGLVRLAVTGVIIEDQARRRAGIPTQGDDILGSEADG
jgi:hypothetical protein